MTHIHMNLQNGEIGKEELSGKRRARERTLTVMSPRSVVLHSLVVWSADVVASIVESGLKAHLRAYLLCAVKGFLGSG